MSESTITNFLNQIDNPVITSLLLALLAFKILSDGFSKRPNWERKTVYMLTDIRNALISSLKPPYKLSKKRLRAKATISAWVAAGTSVIWFMGYAFFMSEYFWTIGDVRLQSSLMLFVCGGVCILVATIYKNSAVRFWLSRN